MSGASLFSEGAVPHRLRDDVDSTPTQERMGPKRTPRRNPSTDQKKARTQMARQSSSTEPTEVEYLQRIASATSLAEQASLSAELAAFRLQRGVSLRTEAAYGNLREASARIAAVAPPAFATHSIASDWLSDAADPTGDARQIEASMRAEASLWWDSRPAAVLSDPGERTVQAEGVARRLASQYGSQAAGANAAFLAQIAHLSRTATEDVQSPPYNIPSGSSLPVGVNSKDTFDDSLLTAPGGPDPQTEKNDTPSLSEGDSPEGDSSEGIENPAVDSTHDTAKGTGYTDPNPSGGTPGSNGTTKAPYATSARKVADDQTSTEADKGDTPSLSEGDSPEDDVAASPVAAPLGTGHDAGPGNDAAIDSIDGTVYKKQSLRAIAASISAQPEAAAPFVTALNSLDSVEGSVAGIPGRDIVSYVLRSATLDAAQRTALEAHLSEAVPPFSREATRVAAGKGWNSCNKCGDQIAKTDGDWHHDNGEKHDHKAVYMAASGDTSPSPETLGGGYRPVGAKNDDADDREPKTRAERADDTPFEKDPGDEQDDWYGDHNGSALRLDPTFASRVQAALPSYVKDLDSDEQYEEGYREGKDIQTQNVLPFADGVGDGAAGKPDRSSQYQYH